MDLWTKRNIMDYLSHPEEIRKAIRAEDEKTKKMGGVIDWNYMLNDMM